ncbi:MAG: biopolymer transporter ExbD [Myxococcota bacterium]
MTRRRYFERTDDGRGASVEMTPLIDIVFILLIFFMVTTSFVKEAGLEIDRPQSQLAETIDEGFLPVAIRADGEMRVADRILPPDSVRGIETALSASGKQRIVIQADRDVPTHLLLEVLDTCRLAGASHVDVAAVPAP